MIIENAECQSCVLADELTLGMPEQDKDKKYALILDSPDMNEAGLHRHFSGQSGTAIAKLLKPLGFSLSDFYLTYAVKCVSTSSSDTDKASRKCKNILYKELESLPNLSIIITFGATACSLITHKRGSLTKNVNLPQEIIINNKKVIVIPTVHPNLIYHNPDAYNTISQGLNVFTSFVYGGDADFDTKKPPIIKIDTSEKFKDAIMEFINAPYVGFDVETTSNAPEKGLRIFDPTFRILTAGFAIKGKAYWINVSHVEDKQHPEWARQLIQVCKDKLIAHNRTFDILSSIKYFNIHDFGGHDTLILAFILDENQRKGLKHLASLLLGWHDYDMEVQNTVSEMKNTTTPNYEDIPLSSLGPYNALDAAATLNLFHLLIKKLSEEEKMLYEFMIKMQNIFIQCTLNGFPVDIKYLAELKQELTNKKNNLYNMLVNSEEIQPVKKIIKGIETKAININRLITEGVIEYTGAVDSPYDVEINFNSKYHLIAILAFFGLLPAETTETGKISTSKKALESVLSGEPNYKTELVSHILEFKKLEKTISTFIKGLKKHIYNDGKIHPMFSLTNTVTGRTSSSLPNIQQIPRDKAIKNIFYAPKGFTLVQYDFAQAEIRVMASFADDENLIDAINMGIDIHTAVASLMFNKPVSEITKDSPERQIAKSCSFGILYGTGPNNLAEMINSTKEDAANKIKIFMDRFPQVQAWINKIHQDVFNYGYVDTPFGRKRRLPTIWSSDNMAVSSAKRQAQNSPIQATASDLNLWLFMYIVHKMDTEKAIPVCTVHDSGVFIVHNSYVDDFILLLKEGEEKLNKIFTFLKVPVIIDIQKGQRWGDMKDISGKENSEEEKEELENEIGLESISE